VLRVLRVYHFPVQLEESDNDIELDFSIPNK
jgi:hypothetical protein